MPDQILKEVTHLGSTLAELATKQLDAVIHELGGPVGDGRKPDDPVEPPRRVNAGTLAFNALQLVSKVGSLLTQLSQYDLVRRNVPMLTLKSSNPLSGLTLQANEGSKYELLLENDGNDEPQINLNAEINEASKDAPPQKDAPPPPKKPAKKLTLTIEPKLESILSLERLRVHITIPGLPEGKYSLVFTVTQGENKTGKIIGKKVVALIVLPAPEQHEQ